jgi:hypothetical protein
MENVRSDLERLPNEHLFDVARNNSACHRLLAIQILVERASPLACRDEIAAEARQFVLSNPLILKEINPAETRRFPVFRPAQARAPIAIPIRLLSFAFRITDYVTVNGKPDRALPKTGHTVLLRCVTLNTNRL